VLPGEREDVDEAIESSVVAKPPSIQSLAVNLEDAKLDPFNYELAQYPIEEQEQKRRLELKL